jgi:hypothetical protein
MPAKKKTFIVKGWVQLAVYAEIEASSLKQAEKIVKEANGNGLPDKFSWEESNWCSSVHTESIEEAKQ